MWGAYYDQWRPQPPKEKPVQTQEAVELPSKSELQIREWRIGQLKRAGYDDDAAGRIGRDRNIDLHRACRIVEQGCDVQTALRILL